MCKIVIFLTPKFKSVFIQARYDHNGNQEISKIEGDKSLIRLLKNAKIKRNKNKSEYEDQKPKMSARNKSQHISNH